MVRSVNDCVTGFTNPDGESVDTVWTYASFVNENHPAVQGILAKAVGRNGKPMDFCGYQEGPEKVLAQVEAVWRALQKRGLRYSGVATSSLADRGISSQHVRRVGESLAATGANCVDGSALIASILRKAELDVYLLIVPHHMIRPSRRRRTRTARPRSTNSPASRRPCSPRARSSRRWRRGTT
jgi:hypothetical protein